MADFRADLHCHSTCSDGTETPERLVQLAVEAGLQGLSITDHDSIDAYQQIDLAAAPLKILPGCELSTGYQGHAIHLLAYGFSPSSPDMQQLCLQQQEQRVARNRTMLELLARNKMPIPEEEVVALAHGAAAWGRPHMAQAMIARKYVGSMREAFQRFLGEGKLCYVPGSRPTTPELVDQLKQMGVAAVLAHPHLLPSRSWASELLMLPWDGIEARYANCSEADCKRWLNMAQKRGWLVTGGSDFHGTVKPASRLGSSFTNEETFLKLYQRYQR